MPKPHNYIPQDYQKCSILVHIGGTWYHARKLGSTWNVYEYPNAKVIDCDTQPVTPWILIEFGESLQYERPVAVLERANKAEVYEFFTAVRYGLNPGGKYDLTKG